MTRSATRIADPVSEHPAVVKCFYPGRAGRPQAESGICGGLLRFSTGLENTDDLSEDIGEALDAAQK